MRDNDRGDWRRSEIPRPPGSMNLSDQFNQGQEDATWPRPVSQHDSDSQHRA